MGKTDFDRSQFAASKVFRILVFGIFFEISSAAKEQS